MDNNRMNAYLQLIKKLRECTSGKEEQILKEHSELLEPGLVETIIARAKESDDNGNQNEANCLTKLALQVLGEFIGSDRQSNEIRKQAANIVFKWGEKQFQGQKFTIASDCWKKCLIIYKAIHDREREASCLINLGHASYSQNSNKEALGYYLKSLRICRRIKNSQKEAVAFQSLWNPYNSLGIAYLLHGEYKKAIKYHKKSLEISEKISDRRGKANSLGNLGCAYDCLGQYEQAINYHKQHFEISKEINDARGQANSLGNLGNAYDSLEQYEQAIDYHKQHFEISKEINDTRGQANSLGNLGNAYNSLRQYEKAIDYYKQSLAITHKIKDRRGEAACLGNLGLAYKFLEQYDQAIHYYEKCLAISQEIRDSRGEAAALGNLGLAYQLLEQTDIAIKNFCDCLKIATPETMPAECFTAGRSLGHIGIIKGDWKLALKGYELAMQAVENLRQGSTTDNRRQKIIAEAISVYANAVQCYINLKQYDRAVETADRSRSRHLADLFASKDLYPQGEIPPEVEEYYRLQQQSDRLRSSENDGTKALATTRQPTPNGDAIVEKIKELETEKQQAWLKIRSKDQVLAAQLQPAPLSFDQMQALISDAETALLNFYTTGEHTHIFILRQNQLPQLHTCEGQGLETLQNWLLNNWLKPYVENRIAWQNQMGEFLPELTNRLQITRLIDQHLNGIKELIIIPHLSLHQIPFAALPLNNIPIPQSNTASDKTRGLMTVRKPPNNPAKISSQKQPEYLSDRFRIRIVPSCQILNFCHQRGNLKPATMGIVENATGDLVFAGYECETLATMHKVTPDTRLQYQQATISNYQNLVNRVQVLHSSHHASSKLDNSIESKLLLFDGDINLGRIFTWRFADLAEVFLSCCETNLTLTEITDDPLSIASGFLCAGARNVVSTLWAVDELATALFCIFYYQEKQENSRSEAIRQAQFKLRNLTGHELSAKYKRQLEDYFEQQKGEQQAEIVNNKLLGLKALCQEKLPFVSPYYWAGFVSQGLA